MFPHHKLDWNLGRLERRLEEAPDDVRARAEYALTALSRALFHDGGEVWYNRALTHARRVLQADSGDVTALVVAGVSLARLDRAEPALRYLDDALVADPSRADVHLGLALLHTLAHDHRQALREMEVACRLAPDAWEPNYLLGKMLWDRAQDLGGPEAAGPTRRLLERSQFHAVRALSLGASTPAEPPLLYQLGISCLHLERYSEATRLFQRLLDHERYRVRAQYYLGLAFYQLGKYKNAVLYLRQHLDASPDSPKVHARLGMCYLQLGEVSRARESCNLALAADPGDVQARWTLGCALLEEGRTEEAVKTFKSILEDAPDHAPAFAELVRVRTSSRDLSWLRQALRAEVSGHDRLPANTRRVEGGPDASPRSTTQDRIGVILEALHAIDPQTVGAILDAMDLTTDENLRFILWESAVDAV
nr:tetratricopeptide repeat protein [Deltaproteobacteria bacterium]